MESLRSTLHDWRHCLRTPVRVRWRLPQRALHPPRSAPRQHHAQVPRRQVPRHGMPLECLLLPPLPDILSVLLRRHRPPCQLLRRPRPHPPQLLRLCSGMQRWPWVSLIAPSPPLLPQPLHATLRPRACDSRSPPASPLRSAARRRIPPLPAQHPHCLRSQKRTPPDPVMRTLRLWFRQRSADMPPAGRARRTCERCRRRRRRQSARIARAPLTGCSMPPRPPRQTTPKTQMLR